MNKLVLILLLLIILVTSCNNETQQYTKEDFIKEVELNAIKYGCEMGCMKTMDYLFVKNYTVLEDVCFDKNIKICEDIK